MITNIVFDFYGTLVGYSHDSVREGETNAYDYLLSKKYELPFEDFRKLLNDGYYELMAEAQAHHNEFTIEDISRRFMKKAFDIEADEKFAREFGRIHVDEWNSGTKFLDGMKDFIEDLGSRYSLSIISNTHCPQVVQRNIQVMKLEGKFDHVVTSIEFGKRKPHPSIFEHTLKLLNARADKSIFVGDTFTDDYLASKAVGMISYLIDEGKKRLDLNEERLNHIFELRERLKE